MKILMQEDLNQEIYTKKLEGVNEQEAAVIRLCAKTGIREDVFYKILELGLGDKTMILYDFLTDAKYGKEWYDLLTRIVNEREDSSAYLNIIHETECSIENAERAYENSIDDFEFSEAISRKDASTSVQEESEEVEDTVDEIINHTKSDADEANMESEDISKDDETSENTFHILKEQESKAPNMYHEVYHELVGETVVEESVKSEHDMLIELAVKAGANYKDLLVKVKDMERIAKIQNRVIEQQNDQIVALKKENDRIVQEKQFIGKEFEEIKRKYESLVTKLTDISTFTGKNMLEG